MQKQVWGGPVWWGGSCGQVSELAPAPSSMTLSVVTQGTAVTPWPILQVALRFGSCYVASSFGCLGSPETDLGINLKSFNRLFFCSNRLDFYCFLCLMGPPTPT